MTDSCGAGSAGRAPEETRLASFLIGAFFAFSRVFNSAFLWRFGGWLTSGFVKAVAAPALPASVDSLVAV